MWRRPSGQNSFRRRLFQSFRRRMCDLKSGPEPVFHAEEVRKKAVVNGVPPAVPPNEVICRWHMRLENFLAVDSSASTKFCGHGIKKCRSCCRDGQGYEVSEVVVQVVQVIHVTKFASEIDKSGTSLQILIPTPIFPPSVLEQAL